MNVIRTDDFERLLRKLPKDIQRLYDFQENRFTIDWHDPRLHVKVLHAFSRTCSLRITRRYRAFFYFQDRETAIFFDIGHRKDIYR